VVEQGNRVEWQEIASIVAGYPEGARLQDIIENLELDVPRRTLQYKLKKWVEAGYISRTGVRRGVRYFVSTEADAKQPVELDVDDLDEVSHFPYSEASLTIRSQIRLPQIQRKPVGYQFEFLNGYRPNETHYLTESERSHLAGLSTGMTEEPAGTFARQMLSRLLIDLSWNSSRLEGNTYSLLETRRLIEFGAQANGKASLDTQMILNHKDALEFLVDGAADLSFNRYTILNLHALLSNNLLPDPQASGRLRSLSVGIGKSVFQPLETPQLIETYFDQLLQTAEVIRDPFEQALFALVQLPYLQAFDDVNKRVSRLAANIPLIKHNLIPLSFTDLPKAIYTEAVLAVYELNRVELLKEVFMWAYERSAAHYQIVRQTLGEPDAFRLQYRDEFKTLVSHIVNSLLDTNTAYRYITEWVSKNVVKDDQAEFQDKVEVELLSLHEGNFARYRIRPSIFAEWKRNKY